VREKLQQKHKRSGGGRRKTNGGGNFRPVHELVVFGGGVVGGEKALADRISRVKERGDINQPLPVGSHWVEKYSVKRTIGILPKYSRPPL